MKENRGLLIFLGIMIAILLAVLLPDYFACDGPNWGAKSANESEAESGERSDIQNVLLQIDGKKYGIRDMSIDYETLTFTFRGSPPPISRMEWEESTALTDGWKRSYARRHGLDANASPCLRLVFRDEHGNVPYTGLSRDSVYRLVVNDSLW